MLRVTVCIASIGRASLVDTLSSIAQCHLPSDVILDVVIADDSASGIAKSMLADKSSAWPFSIKVVTSAAGNISIARNTCLNNATGDYLAFIDDDETADKDWISDFVMLAKDTGADAIFGPVDAIYPPDAAHWICAAQPFVKVTGKNGDKLSTGSTCNAFVKKSTIARLKLSFRPDLGTSGGEDTAFFNQLSQLGGLLIASEKAKVYEKVPLERLTLSHLSRRYIRGGQTYANLFISSRTIAARFIAYAIAFIKLIVLLPVITLSFLIKKDLALKYAFKFWLNIGRLRCLLNMPMIRLY